MTQIIGKAIDIQEVKDYINSLSPESKIYIGADSERFRIDGRWFADYTVAIVVHKNGNNGCSIFGEITREQDWDQRKDRPRMRMLNEVYKASEMYRRLGDILVDRKVEVHLDINPDEKHGSSCALNEAIGYIRGTCNLTPKVKPEAWAASYCADRYKEIENYKHTAPAFSMREIEKASHKNKKKKVA